MGFIMDMINISSKYNSLINNYMLGIQTKEDVLLEVEHKFGGHSWLEISYLPDLPEKFIDSFRAEISWDGVSTNGNLSTEFIMNNLQYLNLNNLLITSNLDVGVILSIISSTRDKQLKNRYYALILAYQDLGEEDLSRVKFLKEICE